MVVRGSVTLLVMVRLWMRLTILMILMFAVSSCASSYTARTQLVESSTSVLIIPEPQQISTELEGRSFALRSISFDLVDAIVTIPELPNELYPKLLEHQVRKGLLAAQAGKGISPPYSIDLSIRLLQLNKGRFMIPNRSVLRVRLELLRPDETKVMSGEYEVVSTAPTASVMIQGSFLPIAFPTSKYRAMSELFPAAAAVVTKIVSGLQQGRVLSEIKIIRDVYGGNPTKLTPSDAVLSDNSFGFTRLTHKDLEEAKKLP